MTALININAVFGLQARQNEAVKRDILAKNEATAEHGLTLTESEAAELAEVRRRALAESERIEIGSGAILRLIDSFSTSTFAYRDNYANILGELLEIFYYIKNETNDLISDEKLVATLKHFFEYRCGGDIELLTGRELDTLLRYFRGEVCAKIAATEASTEAEIAATKRNP